MQATTPQQVDQIFIIVISGTQADSLADSLLEHGFYVTRIDSYGGLLSEPRNSLLVGFDHPRQEDLLALVRRCCAGRRQYIPTQVGMLMDYGGIPMIEAHVGGATVYALDVEHFEQV